MADLEQLACENAIAIRPFVVGRKAWLFADSVRGAKASMNLYSLIETCKANGVEPYAYRKRPLHRLSMHATNCWKMHAREGMDGKTSPMVRCVARSVASTPATFFKYVFDGALTLIPTFFSLRTLSTLAGT